MWRYLLVWLLGLPLPAFAGGVVLTFDDWFVDQWHDFFIKDMQANHPDVPVRATFFVSHWLTDVKGVRQRRVGNNSHYVKLKQLQDAGHEIAAHGLNHIGVDEAPYRFQPHMAQQYYLDEVAPALAAMAEGDPDVVGDYGFVPKSFAYPYGARTAAYDKVLKDNGLLYLRGTSEIIPSLPMRANDAIFHRVTDVRSFLVGDGIDRYYQNSVPEVVDALRRAKDNNEVVTLYAHRILPDGSAPHNFGIYASDLKAIILAAHNLGLRFYRFSESYQEGVVIGGGSGSDGNNANKITVTVEGNRVRLAWDGLANSRIDIAPANQPDMPVASASTSGAASGKIGITIPNPQVGQQYVAVFYLQNARVATSNPFVVATGSGGTGSGGTGQALFAPTQLVSKSLGSGRVQLTWRDNSTNETGFIIERCAGNGCTNFAVVATVGANVQGYIDAGLQIGTYYRYQVRAFNADASSPYSIRNGVTAR